MFNDRLLTERRKQEGRGQHHADAHHADAEDARGAEQVALREQRSQRFEETGRVAVVPDQRLALAHIDVVGRHLHVVGHADLDGALGFLRIARDAPVFLLGSCPGVVVRVAGMGRRRMGLRQRQRQQASDK